MQTAFAPALWGLGRCVSDVLVAAASGSRAQRVQSMGLLRRAVSQNAPYSGGMMLHPRRMMWRSHTPTSRCRHRTRGWEPFRNTSTDASTT